MPSACTEISTVVVPIKGKIGETPKLKSPTPLPWHCAYLFPEPDNIRIPQDATVGYSLQGVLPLPPCLQHFSPQRLGCGLRL